MQNSQLLLVVLSPSYLKSEWCRQERAFFREATENLPENDSRLFVLDLGLVNDPDIPAELSMGLRADFWRMTKVGRKRTLGYPVPDPKAIVDRPYFDQVLDLAEAINNRLEVINGQAGQRPSVSSSVSAAGTAGKGRTIFLAEPTEDVEPEHLSVARYLSEQHGYTVFPAPEAQLNKLSVEDCQCEIDEALEGCVAFGQILGSLSGAKLPGSNQRLVEIQYRRAYERMNSHGLPLLQWVVPSVDLTRFPKESEHRQLLESPHVRPGSIEEFRLMLAELAAPPGRSHSEPPQNPDADCPFIFVQAADEITSRHKCCRRNLKSWVVSPGCHRRLAIRLAARTGNLSKRFKRAMLSSWSMSPLRLTGWGSRASTSGVPSDPAGLR
ncbi:MAG: toll/interleukin-1 receptor domain-containing protein [Planctomycetes bacterium]|nr:toll/interleukin-1 receptor domain-containing protein [Planctomycetota bacterium]